MESADGKKRMKRSSKNAFVRIALFAFLALGVSIGATIGYVLASDRVVDEAGWKNAEGQSAVPLSSPPESVESRGEPGFSHRSSRRDPASAKEEGKGERPNLESDAPHTAAMMGGDTVGKRRLFGDEARMVCTSYGLSPRPDDDEVKVVDAVLYAGEEELMALRLDMLKDVIDTTLVIEGDCSIAKGEAKEVSTIWLDEARSQLHSSKFTVTSLVHEQIDTCSALPEGIPAPKVEIPMKEALRVKRLLSRADREGVDVAIAKNATKVSVDDPSFAVARQTFEVDMLRVKVLEHVQKDDDIVLISDAKEVPSREFVMMIRTCQTPHRVTALLRHFSVTLAGMAGEAPTMQGTTAVTRGLLSARKSGQNLREYRGKPLPAVGQCRHLSTLSNEDKSKCEKEGMLASSLMFFEDGGFALSYFDFGKGRVREYVKNKVVDYRQYKDASTLPLLATLLGKNEKGEDDAYALQRLREMHPADVDSMLFGTELTMTRKVVELSKDEQLCFFPPLLFASPPSPAISNVDWIPYLSKPSSSSSLHLPDSSAPHSADPIMRGWSANEAAVQQRMACARFLSSTNLKTSVISKATRIHPLPTADIPNADSKGLVLGGVPISMENLSGIEKDGRGTWGTSFYVHRQHFSAEK